MRWPPLARPAAIVVGATLVSLLLAESALRVLGAVAQAKARTRLESSARTADGVRRPTVAFIGDSNIYGLYIENDADTLPKVVERLSRSRDSIGVFCTNSGLPASPSWAVVEQCREALRLNPAAVVIRCGINNTWTLPPEGGLGWLEHSKLVRFLRLSYYNYTGKRGAGPAFAPDGGTAPDAAIRLEGGRSVFTLKTRDGAAAPFESRSSPSLRSISEIVPRYREDLLLMSKLCSEAGAKPIYCTYLASDGSTYAALGEVMRQVAAEVGAPVADCGAVLTHALTRPTADEPQADEETLRIARRALLLTRDDHPTVLGYAMEAPLVLEALATAQVLKSPKAASPVDLWGLAKLKIPVLRLAGASGRFVEIEGLEPGDTATLWLGHAGTTSFKGLPLPLDPAPVRSALGRDALLSAPVGPRGLARVAIPELPPRLFPLLAVAVVERGGKYGAARPLRSMPLTMLRPR
ncbi:MAG: hypothetical protein JNJ88_00085 [Planctomycetes bacterium]|nr:hypothetical protein [Planctomycetota bacterium]